MRKLSHLVVPKEAMSRVKCPLRYPKSTLLNGATTSFITAQSRVTVCISYWFRMSSTSTQQSKTDFCRFPLFNHIFKAKFGAYFAPISNVVALPQHLVALLLKIVTFNTVLKIVTLLYNGHLCYVYQSYCHHVS